MGKSFIDIVGLKSKNLYTRIASAILRVMHNIILEKMMKEIGNKRLKVFFENLPVA